MAARWSQIQGFDWVVPETGWQELYTQQAYTYLQNQRAISIPTIQAAWFRGFGNAPIPAYAFVINPPPDEPVPTEITRQLETNIFPRLQYDTPGQIRNYVQNLAVADRMVLRYALDLEFARLSSFVGPDPSMVPAQELYQQLYSELNHISVKGGDVYGLAAPVQTTLFDILGAIGSNANFVPQLATFNRGTMAQRIAFLADTDYPTFRARELAFINAQFGANPTGDRANSRRSAVNSIPTAQQYYLSRSLLIHSLTTPNFNINVILYRRITVQVPVPAPGATIVSQPAGGGEPRYSDYIMAPRTQADPAAEVDRYIYNRYLFGGTGGMGDDAYFALDRYNQENMAFPYLAGWQEASRGQQAAFADNLLPADRGALLDSLVRIAQEFRASGDLQTAETAREMAAFIRDRFNNDLARARQISASDPTLISWLSSPLRTLQGINGISPQELNQLPLSIRRLTEADSFSAFLRWRAANPVNIRYEPAFGLEFIDRAILNAADFLSPVYRTGERLLGLAQGWVTYQLTGVPNFTRTDQFSGLDAIRQVMSGNYNVNLATQNISYNPGSIALDLLFTGLTVMPFGTGTR